MYFYVDTGKNWQPRTMMFLRSSGFCCSERLAEASVGPEALFFAVKLWCWPDQAKSRQKYQLLHGDSIQALKLPINERSELLEAMAANDQPRRSLSLSAVSMAVVPHVPRAVKRWGLAHYLPSLCHSSPMQQLQAGRRPWKLKLLSHGLGNRDLKISLTCWNRPGNGQSSLFLWDSSDMKTRHTMALYIPVCNCLINLASKQGDSSSVRCVS